MAKMNSDQIADAVMKIDKVLLDDECIAEIDNLEALGAVTHLHLQRNRLQSIGNLESLQHLQLLSLASNDIMDLRNLTCLCTLKALDIGYNLLDEVSFPPPALSSPPSLPSSSPLKLTQTCEAGASIRSPTLTPVSYHRGQPSPQNGRSRIMG